MNAILQYLEDEEKKIAAAIKEFFAGLRAHPAVAEPPADFSPAPPPGEPAPVAPPAEPPAAAVPVEQPPGGNTTDPTAPGFIPPAVAPAPAPAPEAPGWSPSPTMKYADCTGQNIPLNPSTTYTITDCPASTLVGANITTLDCDPYILVVNGTDTPHPVQTGQCTAVATGPTVIVSVKPMAEGGVVNLFLQVHEAA